MPDYSLGDVARILKVSPRRLRYWPKTRLVKSDGKTPVEAGDVIEAEGEEGYAFRDLVVLRAIVSLVDKGIPLQRIRRNLEVLRDRRPELDDPASALRVLDEDSPTLVVRHDDHFSRLHCLDRGDDRLPAKRLARQADRHTARRSD